MTDFDRALPIVLRLEGGYSDTLNDKGGPTNYGVTQATYDEWRTLLGEPPRSVHEIEAGEVEALYRRLYWERMDCDQVEWPINLIAFDAAVNHGPGNARTMMAAADFADGPRERVAHALLAIRLWFYRRLAVNSPTQRRFLVGWERRVDVLRREAGL